MKLLQFPWARHDSLLSHALVLASLVAAFFLTENFVKRNNSFFSVQFSSRKVCDFLHKNFYKVEALYICGNALEQKDFFHNDWRSVREGSLGAGDHSRQEEKKMKGHWGMQGDRHDDHYAEHQIDFTIDTNNPAVNENLLIKSRMIFKKLDSDNNSVIDLKEFKRNVMILSHMRSINEKVLGYLFDLFDVNKDEKIDYVEFLSLNSYDFNYVKLIQILFDEDNVVEESTIFNYLKIYFSEFLDNVVDDMMEDVDAYFFTRKDELVQSLVNKFWKNERHTWDINGDEKLQLEEFQNFQLSLLVQIDHLANFLHLDLNFDGHIDVSELLFYISHDGEKYRRLRAYLKGHGRREHDHRPGVKPEALFSYIRDDLQVDDSLVRNLQFLFNSFDVNGDYLLDLEEYKDQMSTFSVLDSAPEVVFSS
ncbi:apicoplast calcium binding protein 1, putative [Plasmodium knowlesi strain H]|uniref:Apicoplast calcium binding protein 1, putative n=3 Tax=Plasmodium knowlesi TaxID=5850 RepID=A0A5K1VP02_PLAKH|nr:apicoplast calcium binding protein 1, putative [Plasmodium knowlesi strain H]OTN66416.1 putative Apicoplast calcium binding protein 1 [Plasmodium knowlesi]CAA9990025.1 apicoplast calcium binding protein 1, putative [Plasmodium knowlesi strain H]SBO24629.1 apicoplast calcium binding protein 1, putative [Plasmodium knowlesi strain H]SBO26186.1 apicoplast calcium binding protein 1, putative [Plasmodium knowlesi strain H]VVS79499.1 apicoplast calcium binding protein 1, putative [Plasmodium know|eukprot:XP_002260040.1 hypothetical protein, conserved in Plasmodium species [Plasmodium knowlesi strain H]